MIEAAERDGQLRPAARSSRPRPATRASAWRWSRRARAIALILVIPDKMRKEKMLHLRALGAEVRMTRSDVGHGHPEYYQDMAERIAARDPGAFYVNQFGNPANPLAHETTTGPEIWEQMGHELDAVVCGVGSGGTITGLSRFFRRVHPTSKWCWPIRPARSWPIT